MITISILGLDQYVVGHYSKDHSHNIADLYEVGEDELLFYAPSSYLFHKGVEQTSWNCIVRVNAPLEYKSAQPRIAKYILETLRDFCINVFVEFTYIDKKDTYEFISKEYPHFITEENMVSVDEEDSSDALNDIFAGLEEGNN